MKALKGGGASMLTLLGQAVLPACWAALEVAHTVMVHMPCIMLPRCVVFAVVFCRPAAQTATICLIAHRSGTHT
jgi:hypothetical protein